MTLTYITPVKTYMSASIIVIVLLLILLGKYSSIKPTLKFKEWMRQSRKDVVKFRAQSSSDMDMIMTLQKTRKEAIYKYCKSSNVSKALANSSVILIHNSKFNLSYIDVPKIGSTFIKQMFSILKHGPSFAKENFTIPRNKVHDNFGGQRKKFQLNDSVEDTLTIVPVRNPYTRLYAAFVDKVYLPNKLQLVSDIVNHTHLLRAGKFLNPQLIKRTKTDGLSVTFSDFLKYALDIKIKRKIVYNHYDPCFVRLKRFICNARNYVVVKQETFERDIGYILKVLNIDKEEHKIYNIILRSLHESRIEDTIPGIIKVTFANIKGHDEIWTGPIVAERLWKSFQIQGYISKKFPLPNFEAKSRYFNVSWISEVFLREMKTCMLSRTKSVEQRREAMLTAYKGVPKDIIEQIQKHYHSDFIAFGYNQTLT